MNLIKRLLITGAILTELVASGCETQEARVYEKVRISDGKNITNEYILKIEKSGKRFKRHVDKEAYDKTKLGDVYQLDENN